MQMYLLTTAGEFYTQQEFKDVAEFESTIIASQVKRGDGEVVGDGGTQRIEVVTLTGLKGTLTNWRGKLEFYCAKDDFIKVQEEVQRQMTQVGDNENAEFVPKFDPKTETIIVPRMSADSVLSVAEFGERLSKSLPNSVMDSICEHHESRSFQ